MNPRIDNRRYPYCKNKYICLRRWTARRCLTPNRPHRAAHRVGRRVWSPGNKRRSIAYWKHFTADFLFSFNINCVYMCRFRVKATLFIESRRF